MPAVSLTQVYRIMFENSHMIHASETCQLSIEVALVLGGVGRSDWGQSFPVLVIWKYGWASSEPGAA